MDQIPSMNNELRKNTPAFSRWLASTPHFLHGLMNYVPALNYMFDPTENELVGQYIFNHLHYFYLETGAFTTLSEYTHKNVKYQGLYDHYTVWVAQNTNTRDAFRTIRHFKSVLSELSNRVFYLTQMLNLVTPFEEVRIDADIRRQVWVGVGCTFGKAEIPSGSIPLQPCVPLLGALLSTIDPFSEDEPFENENVYDPSLPVYFRLPELFVQALYEYVQLGVRSEIYDKIQASRKYLNDLLDRIQTRKETLDNIVNQGAIQFVRGEDIPENPQPANVAKYIEHKPSLTPEQLRASLDYITTGQANNIRNVPTKNISDMDSYGVDMYGWFKNELDQAKQATKNKHGDLGDGSAMKQKTIPLGDVWLVSRDAFLTLADYSQFQSEHGMKPLYTIKKSDSLEDILTKNADAIGYSVVFDYIASMNLITRIDIYDPGIYSYADPQPETPPDSPQTHPQPIQAQENSQVYPSSLSSLEDIDKPVSQEINTDIESNDSSAGLSIADESASKYAPYPTYGPGTPPTSTINNTPANLIQSNKPIASPNSSVSKKDLKEIEAKKIMSELKVTPEYSRENVVYSPETLSTIFWNANLIYKFNLAENTDFWEDPFNYIEQKKSIFGAWATKQENDNVILVKYSSVFSEIYNKKIAPLSVNDLNDLMMDWYESKSNLPNVASIDPSLWHDFWENAKNKETIEFFTSMDLFQWHDRPIDENTWREPWPLADKNELQRAKYAEWPSKNNAPMLLNKMCGLATNYGFMLFATVQNTVDLILGQVSFTPKNHDLKRNFWNKNQKMNSPFAEAYTGNTIMDDPGRIAVSGDSFTTYVKVFRDPWMTYIFSKFAAKFNAFTFIVDLKGCHGCFQAALTKTRTPILYSVFSAKTENQEKLDLWNTIVQTSNGTLTLDQKRYMKIIYYAALNGGSVKKVQSLYGHLKVYQKTQGSPEYNDLTRFAQNMFESPVMNELKSIYSFWESLKGQIYVPTRVLPISRKYSEKEAASKNNQSKNPSKKIIQDGDPATHRLPTLVYTTLEVIFIQRVIAAVYRYCAENNILVNLSQGIHDGVLFISNKETNLELLEKYVNARISQESQALLGVELSVSASSCLSEDWLKRLTSTSEELEPFQPE